MIQQTGLDLGLWFREGLCSVLLFVLLARLLLYFVFSAAAVISLLFSSVVASSRAVMAQSADAADTHAEAAAGLASTAEFIDNQVAQGGPSRQEDDALERLLQKSRLLEDAAAWKKPNSRKHWFVRGRIPPNIGEAPADIQAFVREGVHAVSYTHLTLPTIYSV